MRFLALAVALCASAPVLFADERPTGAEAYRPLPDDLEKRFVESWKERIRFLESRAIDTKRGIRRLPNVQQKRAAAAEVKAIDEEVARLRKNDPPFVPPLREFEAGNAGRLEYSGEDDEDRFLEVLQVIDDDEALVTPGAVRRSSMFGPYEKVLADEPIWIKGAPTKGQSDGKPFKVSGVFRVAGTKSYRTALGSQNTVVVLEPLDLSAINVKP